MFDLKIYQKNHNNLMKIIYKMVYKINKKILIHNKMMVIFMHSLVKTISKNFFKFSNSWIIKWIIT